MRLTIPLTDHREIEEIEKSLASGFLTQGPQVAAFEERVAALIGARFAIATSSCTTALHISLVALGIQSGDEVLLADFTFPATGNVVAQQGARPVLVDIEPDGFAIQLEDLARKITPRSKAIIPVHPFGCAADMDPLLDLAAQHGIPVVEDAATALGTTYYGRYCGNLGTLGCFSFHPRKVITTGEGGMVTTNDAALAERIQMLRNHGGVRVSNRYEFHAGGYNYRMSDLQGAMGVAQMEKLSAIIEKRRFLAQQLTKRLKEMAWISTPSEPAWGGHIYQSYVARVDDGIDRDALVERMAERGIETTIGTYALHDQPFFQTQYGYQSGELPNSHRAFLQTITLPLYPQMGEEDLDALADALKHCGP
jgi:perosamine synthetase